MNITNPSKYFTECLEYQGTNIFLKTCFPTQTDLTIFPHIELTSLQLWNPYQIEFPSTKYYAKEDIEARNVSSIGIKFHQSIEDDEGQITDEEVIIFNTQRFNHRLVASVRISGKQAIVIDSTTKEQQQQVAKLVTEQPVKDIHNNTLPEPPKNPTDTIQPRTLLSAERHSKTTPKDFIEKW